MEFVWYYEAKRITAFPVGRRSKSKGCGGSAATSVKYNPSGRAASGYKNRRGPGQLTDAVE